MNEKIAVFPGSFDPFTLGHYDILLRSLNLFDKIYILISDNSNKKCMYDSEERFEIINKCLLSYNLLDKVFPTVYHGLIKDFCFNNGINHCIRSFRNTTDFDYEMAISNFNYENSENNLETVFIMPRKEYLFISSSIVRELLKYNQYDVLHKYVPDSSIIYLKIYYK